MSVIIKSPAAKAWVLDCVSYDDGWAPSGQRERCRSIPKAMFDIRKNVVAKILAVSEMGWMDKAGPTTATEPPALEWLPMNDMADAEKIKKLAETKVPVGQRFLEEPVKFEEDEVACVAFFRGKRKIFDEVVLDCAAEAELQKAFGVII